MRMSLIRNNVCTWSAGETFSKSGGGFFPRQRFERHQTALRVMDTRLVLVNTVSSGGRMPWIKMYRDSLN